MVRMQWRLTLSFLAKIGSIRTFLTMTESIQAPHGLLGTLDDSYTSPDSLRTTHERICTAVNIYVHTKGLARGSSPKLGRHCSSRNHPYLLMSWLSECLKSWWRPLDCSGSLSLATNTRCEHIFTGQGHTRKLVRIVPQLCPTVLKVTQAPQSSGF